MKKVHEKAVPERAFLFQVKAWKYFEIGTES
jgi:hypothetical protein